MNYRLPQRSTMSCSAAGCSVTTSWSDAQPGTRAAALHGWSLGPERACCPDHAAHTAATRLLAG